MWTGHWGTSRLWFWCLWVESCILKSRNKGFASCRTWEGLRETMGMGADGHGCLMYVTLSSVEKTRPICMVWSLKMAVFLLLVHPLLNQLLLPLHLLTRLCAKNGCFWIVLEETLESPLDYKEIKPVNLEGNQPWIFTGRTDAEAEAPILWPPDAKTQLIGKDPDAEKNGRQKEKSMRMDSTTDSMDMNLNKLWEMVKDRGAWHAAVHQVAVRHDLVTK